MKQTRRIHDEFNNRYRKSNILKEVVNTSITITLLQKKWLESRGYRKSTFIRDILQKAIAQRDGYIIEIEECQLRIHILEEMLKEEEAKRQKFIAKREQWKTEYRANEIDKLITDGYIHAYSTPKEAAKDLERILDIPYDDLIILTKKKWKELSGENGKN